MHHASSSNDYAFLDKTVAVVAVVVGFAERTGLGVGSVGLD